MLSIPTRPTIHHTKHVSVPVTIPSCVENNLLYRAGYYGTTRRKVIPPRDMFLFSHCSLAARQAVGIAGTDRRRIVNLTQLRRNQRKCADKTGGRKRPRAADVDVVAPPDADAELGAALLGSPGPAPSPAPPASPAIVTDICHSCDAIELPPRKKAKRRGPVSWVKCDACTSWDLGTHLL